MNADRPAPMRVVRRDLAHWRRASARLQVLLNTGAGGPALAAEAAAMRRQCERLAADLGRFASLAPDRRR